MKKGNYGSASLTSISRKVLGQLIEPTNTETNQGKEIKTSQCECVKSNPSVTLVDREKAVHVIYLPFNKAVDTV